MPRFSIAVLLLCIAGCTKQFGTGGTGEYVVPEQELREVPAITMRDLGPPVAPPTTMPTTQQILATRPAAEVRLRIEECRQMALANDLGLRVELINPTIARATLSEEEARFEWLFVGSATYSIIDQPTGTQLDSNQATGLNVTPGLQIPLRTGGTISLDVPIERSETDNQFATLNPAYTSDVRARISQPILRGFGRDANVHPIRVAFYQYQSSEARAKLEVTRVLADVDRAYWRLYAARRQLDVRKSEYDLAVAQLERARNRARVGQDAAVEVVRAESGAADKLEQIILAENNVRDRQRQLKRIINDRELPMGGATVIVPGTEPTDQFYKLDADHLVRVAQRQRMEMLEEELQILQETSQVAFAKNQALPLVSLDYTYNVNGLGSSLDDSLRLARQVDFEDHFLGLRVEVPIGNEAAKSRLRRALAGRMQRIASKEQRASLIEQEVLNAVDQFEANWQRILAARKRVELAKRVLEAEIRQFEQRLRTSTDVLDAQTRLGDAASSLVNALTEYQISQVDLAFSTGTVLGAAAVRWEPTPAPKR